jgi:hypothetical protein
MNKFLFSLFLLTSGFSIAQDSTDCPDLKSGFFGYSGEFQSTIMYRTKKHQIEYDLNTDTWIILELNWTSNCQYEYTFYKTTMSSAQQFIGITMTADITSFNEKGYNYSSFSKDEAISGGSGTIIYRDDTSKKTKKLVKKTLRKNT